MKLTPLRLYAPMLRHVGRREAKRSEMRHYAHTAIKCIGAYL